MKMSRLESERLRIKRPGFVQPRLLMEHERWPKRGLNVSASGIVCHHREHPGSPPGAGPLNCHGRLLQFDFTRGGAWPRFATTGDALTMAAGPSGSAAPCGSS